MSPPQTIDFSKYDQGGAPPASAIDFSKYEQGAGAPSLPGFWDTLGREGKSLAGNIAGIPAAVYHAFADPPTQDEKAKFGADEVAGPKRVGLGIHRLAIAPAETAVDWYSDALRGKIPNAYEQALSAAPEAMGAGGAAVLTPKIAENIPAAAGATVDAAGKAIPPVVRGVAKGTNAVLAKAPGSIGAAAGAGVGSAIPIPGATIAGTGIGYALGKELLPKLRVPGEDFGISRPTYPGAPLPEHPGTFPGAPEPTATPEQLNPALVSESRSLPGQVGADRIYGPKPAAAEPIPARPGLALKGEVEALRQPVTDIVNQAVPPSSSAAANGLAQNQVDFYLRRGNVQGAEDALDALAKKTNPEFRPPVNRGSTSDIRRATQRESQIPPAGSAADQLDDRATQQEMNWDLERHGWMAESDARKEFIARNSTGITKGDLTGAQPAPVKYTKTPGVTVASPKSAATPAPSEDLVDLLQKSLDAAKRAKAQH